MPVLLKRTNRDREAAPATPMAHKLYIKRSLFLNGKNIEAHSVIEVSEEDAKTLLGSGRAVAFKDENPEHVSAAKGEKRVKREAPKPPAPLAPRAK